VDFVGDSHIPSLSAPIEGKECAPQSVQFSSRNTSDFDHSTRFETPLQFYDKESVSCCIPKAWGIIWFVMKIEQLRFRITENGSYL
jgi:hypothetical protein